MPLILTTKWLQTYCYFKYKVIMGRWIDPSWGEPIELFLIPTSAPLLV